MVITTILLYSFIAIAVINCIYYVVFSKFSFAKHPKVEVNLETPVSIIVYTKNEAELLPNFLAQFENQTHKNYELVLVNNASTDDTRYIFEAFQKTHSNVQVVNVVNNEAFWGSRKYAITLGIKKAAHEKLLFTTTSTQFNTENWITLGANALNNPKQIYIGHSFFKTANDFTSVFIRFSELVFNLINYGKGAITKPFYASQTNFGYEKSLFFENNGFSNHMNIKEGTEDLFLKHNATLKNVIVLTSEVNSVQQNSFPTFSKWLTYKAQQKKITTYYSFWNKFNLRLFGISQFLFFVLAIIAVLLLSTPVVFAILGLRYLITGIVLTKTAFKLKDPKAVYFFPFLEIMYSIVQIAVYIRKLQIR